jgi:hypothetical protein
MSRVVLDNGITLTSADGHEFRALVIGWRLWRWWTWFRAKSRGIVTVTHAGGREEKVRVIQ